MDVVAGVDIGGTNTVVGLVTREGEILAERRIDTTAYPDVDLFCDAIAANVASMAERIDDCLVRGIGIGAPNGNYYSGTIEEAPNLVWKGIIPFADLLGSASRLPVSLTNDANAAAIGEMMYGAARHMRDFVLVTLGTGLGSGFVTGGELMYGSTGFAGELGHVIVVQNGRRCGCGRRGCLETYVSAPGIVRTVGEVLAEYGWRSDLAAIPLRSMTSRDVADAAAQGDVVAREAFERTGTVLGRTLANIAAITSPEAFILFGGLAASGRLIFEPTQREMESNMLPVLKGSVRLLMSKLMESNAAVLGAAALAWTDLDKGIV
jgi:glucokinase